MKKILWGFVLVQILGSWGDISAQNVSIPYNGYIEHNGAPVTGRMNLAFFFVAIQNQPVGNQNSEGVLWWETHEDVGENDADQKAVAVSAGAFTVELGKHNPFPEGFFSTNQTLYLGIMLKNENGWRELGSTEARQLILPTPFAVNALEANDFTVRGSLGVAGNLQVNQSAIIRGAQSEGVHSNGTLALISPANEEQKMVLDGNEIDTAGTLYIQQNPIDNPAGRQKTVIGGDLEVQGKLEGVFTIEGTGENGQGRFEIGVTGPEGTSNTVDMGSTQNRICFLVRQTHGDPNNTRRIQGIPDFFDGTGFRGTCDIRRMGIHPNSTYRLEAEITGSQTDARDNFIPAEGTVRCRAECLSW